MECTPRQQTRTHTLDSVSGTLENLKLVVEGSSPYVEAIRKPRTPCYRCCGVGEGGTNGCYSASRQLLSSNLASLKESFDFKLNTLNQLITGLKRELDAKINNVNQNIASL